MMLDDNDEKINKLINRSKNREDLLENIVQNSRPIINFQNEKNFLVLAREWNSWYPSTLKVMGGCYFFNINGEIIVIDPGFNTLDIIRNNNLDIRLIRHIFVTHFHPDHFESLTTLLTRLTSKKNKLTLYLNTTTFNQFKIYSRGFTEFLELKPGMVINLNFESKNYEFNVKVEIGKAFHKEIGGAMDSVGLKICLSDSSNLNINIGFTGDTDGLSKYINYYKEFYKDCRILILHLGALHKSPNGYKHLYKEGIEELLKKFNEHDRKEKFIFIGEFGFELATEDEYKRVFKEIIPSNIKYNTLIKIMNNALNSLNQILEEEKNGKKVISIKEKNGYFNFLLEVLASVFKNCLGKINSFRPNLEILLPLLINSSISIRNNNGLYGKSSVKSIKTSLEDFSKVYSDNDFIRIWNLFLKTAIFNAEEIDKCQENLEKLMNSWNLTKLMTNFKNFLTSIFNFFKPKLKQAIINQIIREIRFYPYDKQNSINNILKLIQLDVNSENEQFEQNIIHFTGVSDDLVKILELEKLKAFAFIFFMYFFLILNNNSTFIKKEKELDGRYIICNEFSHKYGYNILPVHPSYKICFNGIDVEIEGYAEKCNHLNKILIGDYNRNWNIITRKNLVKKEFYNVRETISKINRYLVDNKSIEKILIKLKKSLKEEKKEFINIIPDNKCEVCAKIEESIKEPREVLDYPEELKRQEEIYRAEMIENRNKFINNKIERAEDLSIVFDVFKNEDDKLESNIDLEMALKKIKYFLEKEYFDFDEAMLIHPNFLKVKNINDFIKSILESKNKTFLVNLIEYILSKPSYYQDLPSKKFDKSYYKLFDNDEITEIVCKKVNELSIEIVLLLIEYYSKKIVNEKEILKTKFFKFFKTEFIKNLFPLIEAPNDHITSYILLDKNDNLLNILTIFGHPFTNYSLHLKNNLRRLIAERKIIYDEDYHLLNVSTGITKIYLKLKNKINKIDNTIKINPVKGYISFQLKNVFILILEISKNNIKIKLYKHKEKFNDPQKKLEEIVYNHFMFKRNHCQFIINSLDEIPYSLDLINQAYIFTKERISKNKLF